MATFNLMLLLLAPLWVYSAAEAKPLPRKALAEPFPAQTLPTNLWASKQDSPPALPMPPRSVPVLHQARPGFSKAEPTKQDAPSGEVARAGSAARQQIRSGLTPHIPPTASVVGQRDRSEERPQLTSPRWYSLTTHPGIEGYGVLGPDGVRVEKWRFAGQTEEHAGPAPDPPRARPLRFNYVPAANCVGFS